MHALASRDRHLVTAIQKDLDDKKILQPGVVDGRIPTTIKVDLPSNKDLEKDLISFRHSNTFKILEVRLPKDVPNTLKEYDTVNKPFDRGKGGKSISEKELSELTQAKFADLNLPKQRRQRR